MSNFNVITPAQPEDRLFTYKKRQESFLRYVFYGACILGLPITIYTIIYTQSTSLNILYIFSYVVLLTATFLKLPYTFKAAIVLVLTYGLSVSNLFETGIWGDARLFLLALIALSVILFSNKVALATGLISIITIAIIGQLVLSGQLILLSQVAGTNSLQIWISASAVLLLLASVIVIGIDAVQREFLDALKDISNYVHLQTEERINLEERVQERTLSLDRRSAQLEAASFVTRAAVEVHDLQELLDSVTRQISERFGYYHVGIFLADASNLQIALVAASSQGGKNMLARGHKFEIGNEGTVASAASQKRARIADDNAANAMFITNADLPNTQSEVALPLLAQNRLIGVLDIQSQEHNAFSADDIYTLQTMTDQIAMAIENIRLIEQSRSAILSLESINAASTSKVWREFIGDQVKGYTYSPLGVNATTDKDRKNQADPSSRNTMRIPLNLRGKDIGSISLQRKLNASSWADSEQEMAQRIATQVVLAIENARLLEESQNRAMREEKVNELSSRFSRSLDVDTLLQNAIRELHKLPQVAEVSVFINPAEQSQNPE